MTSSWRARDEQLALADDHGLADPAQPALVIARQRDARGPLHAFFVGVLECTGPARRVRVREVKPAVTANRS